MNTTTTRCPSSPAESSDAAWFARVIGKRDFQTLLSSIRSSGSGATVNKLSSGYEVIHPDGYPILRAMNGARGYLCRFKRGHFSAH